MALTSGVVYSGGKPVDGDQMPVIRIDGAVGGGAVPVSGTLTQQDPTANALAGGAGTVTAGASAQLVAANGTRKGLQVTLDPAAAANAYFLLGAGTASATNFHFALGAGGSWDGTAGNVVWTGAVQVFSSGTPRVGVVEV